MPTVEAIAPSFYVEDLGRSIDWYLRVLRDPDGNDIYIGQEL